MFPYGSTIKGNYQEIGESYKVDLALLGMEDEDSTE